MQKGVGCRAWAHDVAYVDWVCAMPPEDLLEGSVELEVGGSIRGGKETSESLSVVERNQCDVVDVVVGTGDAARLDRDDPLIAVESADVPEASRGKPAVGELVVRLEH